MTVGGALELYEAHLVRKGNRPASIRTTLHRLRALLDEYEPVTLVNESRAEKLYEKLAGKVRVDTHRNTLGQAKTMWRWLVAKGHAQANPWEKVEGIGRRSRGKEQLSIDDARRLVAHAVGDRGPGGTAALLALLCGLRASEVSALHGRDIDDGGRILVVRGTKTDAAHRRVAVPEVLHGSLAERLPVGLDRYQLLRAAQATMREAGVSVVTLHGLRGTHATLATEVGMASQAVASALGHSSDSVTKGHYILPGTVEAVQQRSAWRVLDGGALDRGIGNASPENCYQRKNADPECESRPARSTAKSPG